MYESRTILRLGAFCSAVVLDSKADSSSTSESRIEAMHAMVTKHTKNFPVFSPNDARPTVSDAGDVVLVTGTTGSLGCHLLIQLVSRAEVKRIYALNRPFRGDKTIRQRQEASLLARGLDAKVLDSALLVLLEGNLVQPMFGLPEDVYNEVSHLAIYPHRYVQAMVRCIARSPMSSTTVCQCLLLGDWSYSRSLQHGLLISR